MHTWRSTRVFYVHGTSQLRKITLSARQRWLNRLKMYLATRLVFLLPLATMISSCTKKTQQTSTQQNPGVFFNHQHNVTRTVKENFKSPLSKATIKPTSKHNNTISVLNSNVCFLSSTRKRESPTPTTSGHLVSLQTRRSDTYVEFLRYVSNDGLD